ncbi:MAG: FecR family protein [Cyclobacteriaceae bacterium]
MEYSSENISESQIITYLNGGELSDPVCEEIADWLQSPENQQEAQRIYKTWELSALSNSTPVDSAKAFRKIKERTHIGDAKTVSIKRWWYAAAASILIALAVVWHLQPDEKTVSIMATDKKKVENLTDNTVVTLNKNSSLTYAPVRFEESDEPREVILKGEGYFEVTPNADKPFIVKTNDIRVTVLGTKFLVKTYNDKPSVVLVTEGKVKVDQLQTGKSYILKGSEEIDLSEEGSPDVKASDDNQLYWKTGVFKFNGTPMSEVINVLESEFDVDIQVSNTALMDCNISVTLKRKSVDTIVRVLTSTFGWESERSGNVIYLKGDGCQ